ncbi:MAG TPA: hypothetical protein VLM89_05960 [Phycisphaerae bacterium]|nr:hypothetical protein [Phycisphaerae bacterium]
MSYTWEYQLDVPPYDKLLEVLEAFFASYPGGDYACERRERFRLEFRRGMWRKSLLGLGPLVPERLAKGRFSLWPLLVRVLARPAPEVYTVIVRYELHLPKDIRQLGPNLQTSVDLHARKELADLADYLAACIGMEQPPAVESL